MTHPTLLKIEKIHSQIQKLEAEKNTLQQKLKADMMTLFEKLNLFHEDFSTLVGGVLFLKEAFENTPQNDPELFKKWKQKGEKYLSRAPKKVK